MGGQFCPTYFLIPRIRSMVGTVKMVEKAIFPATIKYLKRAFLTILMQETNQPKTDNFDLTKRALKIGSTLKREYKGI